MDNIKGTGDPIPVSDDEEPTEIRVDDLSIAKEMSEVCLKIFKIILYVINF